jgi:hypothetical protein
MAGLFMRPVYLPHDGLHAAVHFFVSLQSFLSLQSLALHSVLAFVFFFLSDAKALLPVINIRAIIPMSIFFIK